MRRHVDNARNRVLVALERNTVRGFAVTGPASDPDLDPVAVGGELFSAAMGKDGTPEGTYEGMVRHNVRTIVGALK